MSIAITAPEKFDFQDLVCVELGLRFQEHQACQLFIEPVKGEDAKLVFGPPDLRSHVEVQVKGSRTEITLDSLASVLCHFPSRESKDTLLERLLNNKNSFVLLVASGRCDDATSVFTIEENWHGQANARPIRKASAKHLLEACINTEPSGTDTSRLKAKRIAHLKSLRSKVDLTLLFEALPRILILERVTKQGLERLCFERLRKSHRITEDASLSLLPRLMECIKSAKSSGANALTSINTILDQAAPPSIRPRGYVRHGAESDLMAVLQSQNCLLLSGPPRTGKSSTARWLAAELEHCGYEVREFSDAEEAERFLNYPTNSPQLVVLDDPLGGSHSIAEPSRALACIGKIIGKLRQNKKLIIAQAQDRLVAASKKRSVAEISTNGISWISINEPNKDFSIELWLKMAREARVPDELKNVVLNGIKAEKLILEPGCLEHLAYNHDHLTSYDFAQIIRFAHQDAMSLGLALIDEGLDDLLTPMSIATDGQEPISLTELAYISGSGGEKLPSIRKQDFTTIHLGASESPAPALPEYDSAPNLDQKDQESIDKLEKRRILTIASDLTLNFSHQYYRSAAESIIDGSTHFSAVKTLEKVERSLFCLSPRTSRATARNLVWLFDVLKSQEPHGASCIDLAIKGLKSIYPGTRDLCLKFLLLNWDHLPTAKQEELPAWVSAVTFFTLDNIRWINGEAWINDESDGERFLLSFLKRVKRDDIERELELIEGETYSTISSESAARLLSYYSNNPDELSERATLKLLSYDEALIRAKACEIWLCRPRAVDVDITEKIFSEEHPLIALSAYKGLIRGWGTYSQNSRQTILSGLGRMLNSRASSIAVIDELVLFDRKERTGDSPPWEVFEYLLPITLSSLPENTRFSDARLLNAVETSIASVPPKSVLNICLHWIDWVKRAITWGRFPTDYLMSFIDVAILSTSECPEDRAGLVKIVLLLPGTSSRVLITSSLVDQWILLTEEEKFDLIGFISANEVDKYWIQAAAITRSTVPKEIQNVVFGRPDFLEQECSQIIEVISPPLLEVAASIYTGQPEYVSSLGKHHAKPSPWRQIIHKIASTEDHPLFELAFRDIFRTHPESDVVQIIKECHTDKLDVIFGLVLERISTCNGEFLPEALAALFKRVHSLPIYNDWIKQLAKYIPLIIDDLSELTSLLIRAIDRKSMLEHLKGDTAIIATAQTYMEIEDKNLRLEVEPKIIFMLERFFQNTPPNIFGTCDFALDFLSTHGIGSESLKGHICARRNDIFSLRENLENHFIRSYSPPDRWIRP